MVNCRHLIVNLNYEYFYPIAGRLGIHVKRKPQFANSIIVTNYLSNFNIVDKYCIAYSTILVHTTSTVPVLSLSVMFDMVLLVHCSQSPRLNLFSNSVRTGRVLRVRLLGARFTSRRIRNCRPSSPPQPGSTRTAGTAPTAAGRRPTDTCAWQRRPTAAERELAALSASASRLRSRAVRRRARRDGALGAAGTGRCACTRGGRRRAAAAVRLNLEPLVGLDPAAQAAAAVPREPPANARLHRAQRGARGRHQQAALAARRR